MNVVKKDILSRGVLECIENGKAIMLINRAELVFILIHKRMLRTLGRLILHEMKGITSFLF